MQFITFLNPKGTPLHGKMSFVNVIEFVLLRHWNRLIPPLNNFGPNRVGSSCLCLQQWGPQKKQKILKILFQFTHLEDEMFCDPIIIQMQSGVSPF